MTRMIKLLKDVRGATAIEYGLVIALIAVGVIISINTIGGQNGSIWRNIAVKFPTIQA